MRRTLATVLFLAACHHADPSPTRAPAPCLASSTFTDGLVDVGGIALHIHCAGTGSPLVVLEAGLENDGTVWNDVRPEIARFARVCVSDRAGLGYSGPAPRPHSNRQMARELHAALAKAGLSGPYVLVGHSMGGMNVRLFAAEHLDEVAGMVLVDASPNDPARLWALVPAAAMAEFRVGLVHEGLDFDTFAAGFADMRASSRSIGDKPLVVLTRGKPDESVPPGGSAEMNAKEFLVWQELQAELPRLSTNEVHVVARNSRHFIQWDAPQLVVASVREVVEAAQGQRAVSEATLLPLASEGAR